MSDCVVPAGRAGKRPAQHDQIEFAAALGFFERGEFRPRCLRIPLLRRLFSDREHQAVADRQHAGMHAVVGVHLGIDGADRAGGGIVQPGIRHAAAPEDVVDGDETAASHQLEATLVVVVVMLLVGVYESEVEGPLLTVGERRPQIVMAALNPGMLKLAGEIADGVLLNYIPTAHVGASIERVRSGGDAQIFAYVHAAVGDFERCAKSARKDLFNYAMADGYANMFRASGFADEVDELRARQAQPDHFGALAAISERMIQSIDFIGSAPAVTDFVRGYVDAGVEHPVLMPLPWGDDRWAVTKATMAAAAQAVD